MSDHKPDISKRKKQHLRAAAEYYENPPGNLFDDYTVIHNALPEIALSDVDISTEFLGKKIAAPIMIDSITGGPDTARRMNVNLAKAAHKANIPLALGSAKIVFQHPETLDSFDVRDLCPDVPLLLNLGLADLDRAFGIDDCRNLVEKLRADALIFHLNPLHEALRQDGNTDFRGLEAKLKTAVTRLDFPIIVKEVGHGISPSVFDKLDACGVYAVNIAGQGGTSWGYIESRRAADPVRKRACETFTDWGIPTPRILEQLSGKKRNAKLIASGGIRNGLDVFKALCLGADLAALAAPFVKPARKSPRAVKDLLQQIILELRLAAFAAGAADLRALNKDMLISPK